MGQAQQKRRAVLIVEDSTELRDLTAGSQTTNGHHRATPMHPPDEFLKRAADCMSMAKFSRDPESRAMWSRMAERWRQCAERFSGQSSAAHDHSPKRHRETAPAWARH
jgi:hypothetical protein